MIMYTFTDICWQACEKFKNEQGWTFVHDDVYQVPYAYKDNAWIGYDNQKSLIAKVNSSSNRT